MLSSVLVGVLSLNRPEFFPIFSALVYCDYLFLWTNRCWIPCCLSLFMPPDMVNLSFVAVGYFHEVWWFHFLPYFKGCFSVSESLLFEKWIILFSSLLFSGFCSTNQKVALTIVLCSLALACLVLYVDQPPAVTYCLIVAGALLEIALLSLVIDQNFVLWFIDWLFDRSKHRLVFLAYWLISLTVAFLALGSAFLSSQLVIIQRKYFHFLSVFLFVPVTLFDPDFMQCIIISEITNRVSFAFAFLLFLLVEIVRVRSLPPFYCVDSLLRRYVDDRDEGPLVLSHFSLLLGCALPVWLGDESHCMGRLSGVIVLGVGDSLVGL